MPQSKILFLHPRLWSGSKAVELRTFCLKESIIRSILFLYGEFFYEAKFAPHLLRGGKR